MKTRFFQLARRAARLSQHPRYKMGALICKKGKIVSFGTNRPEKTHPKSYSPWKRIHSELDAIIGLDRTSLMGADIYVVRITKTDSYAISRPCAACYTLLKEVGIKKVFYIDKEGKFQKEVLY